MQNESEIARPRRAKGVQADAFARWLREAHLRDRTPGFVYFVQGQHRTPIKIGHATDPEARVRNLQTGCPMILRILFQTPGTKKLERSIHDRFEYARLHGEWFEPVLPILALIEEWKIAPPPEPVIGSKE